MTVRRVSRRRIRADDESTESEIRVGADGRVHVFGTSREILEALAAIGVRGDAVRLRLGGGAAAIADGHHPSAARAPDEPGDEPA